MTGTSRISLDSTYGLARERSFSRLHAHNGSPTRNVLFDKIFVEGILDPKKLPSLTDLTFNLPGSLKILDQNQPNITPGKFSVAQT